MGAYFIGYHRPSYHPAFASISARFLDLAHYVVLWSGNYFSTGFASPFFLGIIVLTLFFSGAGFVLWTIWQRGDWRTFYAWLLLGAFACGTVTITALGRLGFGVEQALDNRYLAFSRFFYIALFGLYFAIYCARVRGASVAVRTLFLTHTRMGARFPRAFLGDVLREKSCGAGRASSDPRPSPARLGMDGADSG